MSDVDTIFEEAKYLTRREITQLILRLAAYLELVGTEVDDDE